MPIVIRPYRDEDWPQVAAIWSLAFFGGQPIDREHRILRHRQATIHVAEDEEGIAGALNLIRMGVRCRGAELATGGVAAVAVAPEHRRQGIGSSMMHWLIGEMRRSGLTLSVLHAAHAGFYRGFGYAHSGRRWEFDCPLAKLPRLHEDLPIQRLTASDWPEMEGAYHTFAGRYSGMLRRGAGLENSLASWILGKSPPTIYAVGRPVEAYAVLHLNTHFYEMQKVAEVVWTTPRGWRALMETLSMLCINASSLSWCEPSDGPYLALHAERGVGVKGWIPPMFRTLDVPGALRALAPEGEGRFTLAVDDELLPENRGPWRVTFQAGQVHVESAGDGPADLEMGIGAFTQALLGEPSLTTLAANGAVVACEAAGFAAARRLLPPHPVYCLDFF